MFESVKLIVSDIDGTLIPSGKRALPEALCPAIRALREAGILFCPASGRQYHALYKLFAPAAEEIGYLCENGAVVMGPGPEGEAPLLSKTVMPRESAIALCYEIMELPSCLTLVSVVEAGYALGKDNLLLGMMAAEEGSRMRPVERFEEIGEILKVSVYAPGGVAMPSERLGPRYGKMFRMAEAGPTWLDFTVADKGKGLRGLCAALGVDPAETLAFGDNWNDVQMLDLAGMPYLMSTAAPQLRRRYPRQCSDVMDVIHEILEERKNGRS